MAKSEKKLNQEFGLPYPKFVVPAAVKKAGSAAHGEYVLAKFKAMQLAWIDRPNIHQCPCTSGCWESDGYAILKAVLKQNSKAMGYVYANG
jgi:hypothetical protein